MPSQVNNILMFSPKGDPGVSRNHRLRFESRLKYMASVRSWSNTGRVDIRKNNWLLTQRKWQSQGKISERKAHLDCDSLKVVQIATLLYRTLK